MTTPRVLILCPDSKGIGSAVKVPSLKGVHFSFLPDWQSGAEALRKENFSIIVAQPFSRRQGAEGFVAKIRHLAPKTPLMLILPRQEGPSVLEALKGGAAEILFEETLAGSLVPCLEKYLFSGYGLLRRMSLDELFDFCIPVITTTELGLLSVTILEKFREALGASFGVLFKEGGDVALPYTTLAAIGFADEASLAARLVHFTGYEMDVDDIRVDDQRDRTVGCMVGAADLIGQMSDRMYLEKVHRFLYEEFVWGQIARERMPDGREVVRYASADDLIIKTPGFYEYVARARIDKKLGGVDRYAEAHFDGASLYQSEIDRNMNFLRETIETAELHRLRRSAYSLSICVKHAA